jgi:hypothetical protein
MKHGAFDAALKGQMTGTLSNNKTVPVLPALPNSDVEADVALGRSAPSGPRSLTPVVRHTPSLPAAVWAVRRVPDESSLCGNSSVAGQARVAPAESATATAGSSEARTGGAAPSSFRWRLRRRCQN